ncbi:MAG TPA: hypothetical protein VFW00_07205 [Rhodocyclaceae bacterium]|nr:hypothetical protein [Rhodocyclaceae bacterium]
MNSHAWKLQILRAAADPDGDIMAALAAQLAECESAKAMLRSGGHGELGEGVDAMVRKLLEGK